MTDPNIDRVRLKLHRECTERLRAEMTARWALREAARRRAA